MNSVDEQGHQVPAVGSGLPPELASLGDRLGILEDQTLLVSRLSGGLTNANFKIQTTKGCFVVRVSSPSSTLLAIDRANERYNTIAAAETGVGAAVVEYLDDPNVLVVDYIDGKTLSAADLAGGTLLDRIAQACLRLHSARPFASDFNMFEIQRRYLSIVKARGFYLPERYLDFADSIADMERAFEINKERQVPCNNDLLAENFIDDGNQIRIIDYEYSGNNEPSFEIGNIWSESNLSLEQLGELCQAYYGRFDQAIVARARLWGLMSKYGWTLWASIQASVAEIEFDFLSWGAEKFDRAVAEFNSADFPRLLANLASSTGGH